MSRIHITSSNKTQIILTKTNIKVKHELSSCCILPLVIEDIIYEYVEQNDDIIVNRKFLIKAHCGHCNDINNNCYKFSLKHQKINGQYVSMTLEIAGDMNKLHYVVLTELTNVANISMPRVDIYQTIPLLNLFMKQYYNKHQYIKQENCNTGYTVMSKNNLLVSYEYINFCGIEVIDKRLFKNIIVIIKCIIDHIQKNEITNSNFNLT